MPFTDAVKGTTVKVNLKGGTDVKIPAGKHPQFRIEHLYALSPRASEVCLSSRWLLQKC